MITLLEQKSMTHLSLVIFDVLLCQQTAITLYEEDTVHLTRRQIICEHYLRHGIRFGYSLAKNIIK